jgi:predicted nucleotidyltransferase
MINQTDILKFLVEQKSFFQQEFQIIKIGLFGSYARGEQSEKSDIDLIVEFAPNTSQLFEKKAQLKSILKKKFNKDVDICREKYIKPYFKNQILNSAIYV